MSQADVNVQFAADLEAVKKELKGLHDYIKQWGDDVKKIGIVAFGAWAGKQVFSGIKGAISEVRSEMRAWIAEAEESELAQIRLNQAVEKAGWFFGHTSAEIVKYSYALSAHSIFSTTEIQQAATAMADAGVSGRAFAESLSMAADVASHKGLGLKETAVNIGRAMNALESGNSSMARRSLRGIINPSDIVTLKTADDLIRLLAKNFGGAAEEIANSGFGVRKVLANIKSDIESNLGQGFLEFLKAIKEPIKILLVHVRELAGQFSNWLKAIAGGSATTTWMEALKTVLISTFAKVEEFFARIPQYFRMLKSFLLDVTETILRLTSSLPSMLFGGIPGAAQQALKGTPQPFTPAEEAQLKPQKDAVTEANQKVYELRRELERTKPQGGGYTQEQFRARQEMKESLRSWEVALDNSEKALRQKISDIDATKPQGIEGQAAAARKAEEAGRPGDFNAAAARRAAAISKQVADMEPTLITGWVGQLKDAMPEATKSIVDTITGNPVVEAIGSVFGTVHDNVKDTVEGMGVEAKRRMDVTIKNMSLGEETKPFKSGFEDARSMFTRIQTGFASDTENVPKTQLQVQREILKSMQDELTKTDATNELLDVIRQKTFGGGGAVAQ